MWRSTAEVQARAARVRRGRDPGTNRGRARMAGSPWEPPGAWFGDVDDVPSMRAAIAAVRWALLGAAPRAAFLRAPGDGAHPGQPRPLRSRL